MSEKIGFRIYHFMAWFIIAIVLIVFFVFHADNNKYLFEQWSYKTSKISTSAIKIFDNNIYFTDQANYLYSMTLDGELNWKLNIECPIATANTMIINDKNILLRTGPAWRTLTPETVTNCRNENRIHITRREQGDLISVIGDSFIFTGTMLDDYIYLSTGTRLHKIDIYGSSKKIILDKFSQDARIRALSSDFYIRRNILYMKSALQDVYAFDLNTYDFKWHHISDWILDEVDSVEPNRTSDSLIYNNGVIYTVHKVQHSTAADVYAFDAESGVILGRYRIEAGASPGRLSASEKYIYIPSNDSRVHALTKRELYPVWDVPTIGPVRGAMVPYQGVVYAGTQAGSIIGLDEETGERVYRYPTEHPIPGTPAIQDGVIYFATNGGSIHAVRLPDK